MRKSPVIVIRESESHWIIWNKKNNMIADITAIADFGYLAKGRQYRVDIKGKTVATMLEHFQTAKSLAIKMVREPEGGIK